MFVCSKDHDDELSRECAQGNNNSCQAFFTGKEFEESFKATKRGRCAMECRDNAEKCSELIELAKKRVQKKLNKLFGSFYIKTIFYNNEELLKDECMQGNNIACQALLKDQEFDNATIFGKWADECRNDVEECREFRAILKKHRNI